MYQYWFIICNKCTVGIEDSYKIGETGFGVDENILYFLSHFSEMVLKFCKAYFKKVSLGRNNEKIRAEKP